MKTKRLSLMGMSMFALAALYYFYEYWLRVAPTVMSAELKQFFSISDPMLGHLAACYYYAYVLMQIPVGVIFDKYPVRWVLSLACLSCVLGTFLFCETDHFLLAQLGRFLMGFGSAFAYVGVLKIASIWFPASYFGISAGVCTALGMIGGYSGLTFIGWLVHEIGWQKGLWYIAWAGVVLTLALFVFLRDKPARSMATVLAKKDSLDEAEDEADQVGKIDHFWAVLGSSKIWLSGLIGSLTYLPISAFAELWAVPYLEARGYPKIEAAEISGILFWGFAIGGPLWGILSASLNKRRLPLILGSVLSAAVSVVLILSPNLSAVVMKWVFFALGLFASAQILVFAVANDLCTKQINATAVAFTNMLVMLGGALLQPVIGLLLEWFGAHPQAEIVLGGQAQDYRYALLVLPIGLVLAALLSARIHESDASVPIKTA